MFNRTYYVSTKSLFETVVGLGWIQRPERHDLCPWQQTRL